jgi:hypothetical protein
VVAALCLSAGIAEPGRAEETTAVVTGAPASQGSEAPLPGPTFLRVDKTRKPVVEGVGLPKEVAKARDVADSVYKPDSALRYTDPPASATGSSSAAPKRVPALAGNINIEGNVLYSLGPTTGYFTADQVANNRSSGTSGTLRLELWATTGSPASGSVSGYQLAIDRLGTLPAGYSFYNINSGTFTYTQPPAGCYYISLFLTEFDGTGYPYTDYVVFPTLVTFRGGTCSGCTEDAYTMCLSGGRYRVTGRWKNQYAGGAQANLSKAKLTDVTGAFWIADANTYEFMVRISTATDNGKAWISILMFTDVEFWVAVTDVTNGQSKEYHSNPGNRTLIYDPSFFVYP